MVGVSAVVMVVLLTIGTLSVLTLRTSILGIATPSFPTRQSACTG